MGSLAEAKPPDHILVAVAVGVLEIAEQAVALAQASEKVIPFLAGKKILKVVYVPGRILNLVVA